jgi:2-dehydro-3-deoxyphosphogluconate aldolase / (4S)-4-hydroxy-2-oxoglutarate aldolase
VIERLERARVVPILRLRDHGLSVEIARILVEAGLDVIEVTLDHPDALGSIRAIADELADDALVGAGTVRHTEDVRRAGEAGARFCVSPHTDPALIAACARLGLEALPGTLTPTDVARALDAGARILKLFPAAPLGTGYLRALLGPFRGVAFVPTGGIAHDEAGAWLEAGAAAVGLGSDLVPAAPAQGDLAAIARRAAAIVRGAPLARVDDRARAAPCRGSGRIGWRTGGGR